MSVDRYDLALVDTELWQLECAALAREAALADRRQRKALVGDRKEALRHDRLAEAIEQRVRAMIARGHVATIATSTPPLTAGPGPSWARDPTRLVEGVDPRAAAHVAAGGVVVVLCDPFAMGSASAIGESTGPIAPQAVERVSDDEGRLLHGGAARRALWKRQLSVARTRDDAVIVPSAVSNAILTQGLRRFAAADGRAATTARVVYRDGSEGPDITLGAVPLGDGVPGDWPVLRLAMMSMRHNDLDPDVDGAWFRNRLLSRSMTEGQTDHLAFDLSVRRLEDLLREGPVVLELHQTGLQPAVMGFYRAVLTVLEDRPGSVVVCPKLHRAGSSTARDADPWGLAR